MNIHRCLLLTITAFIFTGTVCNSTSLLFFLSDAKIILSQILDTCRRKKRIILTSEKLCLSANQTLFLVHVRPRANIFIFFFNLCSKLSKCGKMVKFRKRSAGTSEEMASRCNSSIKCLVFCFNMCDAYAEFQIQLHVSLLSVFS